MGRAIVVRTEYTSGDIRRAAQRVKNAARASEHGVPHGDVTGVMRGV
jgi:hypothetical protein